MCVRLEPSARSTLALHVANCRYEKYKGLPRIWIEISLLRNFTIEIDVRSLEPAFDPKCRWFSLRKAAFRILEEYPNLKQHFLVYLPLQKNFKRENFPLNRVEP